MEVKRNTEPKNNFLRKIQNLARKKYCFIFDECSSGFRELCGIYKKYNLDPDMVIFEKLWEMDMQLHLY